VCVCVCVCVRARVRVCVCVCVYRVEDKDCGEKREGIAYRREIVTPYWETTNIIVQNALFVHINKIRYT